MTGRRYVDDERRCQACRNGQHEDCTGGRGWCECPVETGERTPNPDPPQEGT